MSIDSFDLKRVAKFIDGLNKLTDDTDIAIYGDTGNAQIHVDGKHVGLRLMDSDGPYQIQITGDADD